MYIRNLLKIVSHFLLKLLKIVPPSQNQRCLMYRQPFDPWSHQHFLCSENDILFAHQMYEKHKKHVRWFRKVEEVNEFDTPAEESETEAAKKKEIDYLDSASPFSFVETRFVELAKSVKHCESLLVLGGLA